MTFEEARRHLGVETQRQWSDLAIARTTPILMGLFSLACLMALKAELKAGVADLRKDMDYKLSLLEQRMVVKLGAMMALAIGVTATLVKLL